MWDNGGMRRGRHPPSLKLPPSPSPPRRVKLWRTSRRTSRLHFVGPRTRAKSTFLRNEPKLVRQRKDLRKLRWCNSGTFVRQDSWRSPFWTCFWFSFDGEQAKTRWGRGTVVTDPRKEFGAGGDPPNGLRCQLEEVGEDLVAVKITSRRLRPGIRRGRVCRIRQRRLRCASAPPPPSGSAFLVTR